jgi:hypothetical protein
MSDHKRVEYTYSTETEEVRRLCDRKPTIYVQLIEQVTTTTRHDDGSVTTHETTPRVIESWVHQPNDGDDE